MAAYVLHGNDLARGKVVEIPGIGRVVARSQRIRKVVKHCVQGEIVEIRKRKAWASVKEMVGRKVVEENAVVSVIGIKPILNAQIEVVDETPVGEVRVVAKRCAIRELQVVNAVAQWHFSREKCRGRLTGRVYGHRVGWTPLAGKEFAHHDDEGLPCWNLNVKCSLRIRARARVSDPVGANVGRIKAAEIGSRENQVVERARR